jgi:hypothetical protein
MNYLLVLFLSLALAHAAAAQQKPQIWFVPLQEHYNTPNPGITWDYYDFSALLEPDAPWQIAARRVDALAISVVHITEGADHGIGPGFKTVKAMIDRLHVKVSGGGSVMFTDGQCGSVIEGVSADKGFAREVYFTTKTWHDNGMPLDYFVMDGPFGFGYTALRDKCGFSPEEVANRTATTMRKIRDLYPNIIIVDSEGPGPDGAAAWLPGYHRFLDAFNSAYGKPIDYINMDLAWSDKWHKGAYWVRTAREITDDLHKRGMKVSLLINAEDQSWDPDVAPEDTKANPDRSMNAQYWMASVRKHIDLVVANNLPLDAIDIESWMKFPRKNLPETDATAWTSVVNYAYDAINKH